MIIETAEKILETMADQTKEIKDFSIRGRQNSFLHHRQQKNGALGCHRQNNSRACYLFRKIYSLLKNLHCTVLFITYSNRQLEGSIPKGNITKINNKPQTVKR